MADLTQMEQGQTVTVGYGFVCRSDADVPQTSLVSWTRTCVFSAVTKRSVRQRGGCDRDAALKETKARWLPRT